MLVYGLGLFAQDRSVSLPIQAAAGLNSAVGKQWAVFIAIDYYQECGPLKEPVKDAKEIRDILLENYYIDEVRELYDRDATMAGIRSLLIGLRSEVEINDSVFVFYAGHGHFDPDTTWPKTLCSLCTLCLRENSFEMIFSYVCDVGKKMVFVPIPSVLSRVTQCSPWLISSISLQTENCCRYTFPLLFVMFVVNF